jgi:hypothetical protein
MDHLDKLIPLAVLLIIGAFLLLVLRRAAREAKAAADLAARAISVPEPVLPPAVVAEVPATPTVEKPRKKRRRPQPVAASLPNQNPVTTVLDLLRDKDALVKAFLLREILDKPVALRKD